MKQKIADFIREHQLLSPHQSVLVGLSGGADSVALVLVLIDLGYSITAAHCNFHLRGEESMRDERFVRVFCEQHQLTLLTHDVDTLSYAQNRKVSVEMAARELRYVYFRRIMKERGIDTLAVAHHQNDQAETILINLIRGTGIHGLRGMLPRNGDVVRPLLCATKEEIIQYLKDKGQDYVTDGTNLLLDYTRNRIRLEIIPMLKTLNPSIIEGLNRTARHLREVEIFQHWNVQELASWFIKEKEYTFGETPITLQRDSLAMKSAKMRPFWHEVFHPYGFTEEQTNNILALDDDACGKMFYATRWCLCVDRETLFIRPYTHQVIYNVKINGTESCVCLNDVTVEIYKEQITQSFQVKKAAVYAFLDFDKLTFPLTLRIFQPGDKFRPFGMKGQKLISDFLTDLKVPFVEKQRQLVLCNSDSRIVWVVGRRISDDFAISEDSKLAFILRLNAF